MTTRKDKTETKRIERRGAKHPHQRPIWAPQCQTEGRCGHETPT